MPYVVKKGKGNKPYNIVNQKTKQVVGTSDSLAKAHRSIGYREDAEKTPRNIQGFTRKVNNHMRSFGETDLRKKTVTINKSKSKNAKGDILDTIVHEGKHIAHPKMKEKNIIKDTAKTIRNMTVKQKQKKYKLFST